MSFRTLFNRTKDLDLSKRSVAVRTLIAKTVAYLRRRAEENPSAEIRPAMLAAAIDENEMIALTALNILEKAGITKSHIGLYCYATMQPVGEVKPGGAAPDTLPCAACGKEHDLDSGEMRREIFFTFDPKGLIELKEAA